jgi:hypothetical protein
MTPEEQSSSAGRPDLDLNEPQDPPEERDALVAGGLCRLDAPDSPVEDGTR